MRRWLLAISACSAAGCSSINSLSVPAGEAAGAGDGLAYYLPRKDLVITIKVPATAGSATTAEITTTAAYPDLSQAYLLRYQRNPFGKNTLNVGITQSGLLNSTVKSKTVNQLGSLADALEELKAQGLVTPAPTAPPADDCSTPGDHRFIVDLKTGLQQVGEPESRLSRPRQAICAGKYTVVIRKLWPDTTQQKALSAPDCSVLACSGLYYRQNRPYVVGVFGKGVNTAQLVESPTESAPLFIPIERTLFADNEATVTFADGVPTAWAQEADGEAIALLKLPARLLKAYFEAVGGVFAAREANKEAEASQLAATLKLELARRQFAMCLAAIQAGKTADEVKALGCGLE